MLKFTCKMMMVAVVCAAVAPAAWGLVIDGSGDVTDWSVSPTLNVATNSANQVAGGVASTLGNDYAPINYPSGVGFVPSPGGSSGETWDLEEMHVRIVGSQLQVLVVNKSGLSEPFTGDSEDFGLGDLFVTTQSATYAMVTRDGNQGLTAGDVYQILDDGADVQILQDRARSYFGNATIEAAAGPWAVDATIAANQKTGSGSINTASFDYGGSVGTHHVVEYLLDVSLIGGAPTLLQTHLTWGCGNDLIEVEITDTREVPEPASLVLMGAGVLLMLRRSGHRAPTS